MWAYIYLKTLNVLTDMFVSQYCAWVKITQKKREISYELLGYNERWHSNMHLAGLNGDNQHGYKVFLTNHVVWLNPLAAQKVVYRYRLSLPFSDLQQCSLAPGTKGEGGKAWPNWFSAGFQLHSPPALLTACLLVSSPLVLFLSSPLLLICFLLPRSSPLYF